MLALSWITLVFVPDLANDKMRMIGTNIFMKDRGSYLPRSSLNNTFHSLCGFVVFLFHLNFYTEIAVGLWCGVEGAFMVIIMLFHHSC